MGHETQIDAKDKRIQELEARLQETQEDENSWWGKVLAFWGKDTVQARIVKCLVVLAIGAALLKYGDTLFSNMPDFVSYGLYVLGVTAIVLVADYLFAWVSALRFYDEHGAAVEMKILHGRIGTPEERTGDNEAIGRQHQGSSIRRGLIFVGVVLLHMHGSMGAAS